MNNGEYTQEQLDAYHAGLEHQGVRDVKLPSTLAISFDKNRAYAATAYHTDLDRDDFEAGELLPWQDMSRHLQALEYQGKQDWDQIAALHRRIDTLEKALQTTTDSLKQAHEKIAAMEQPENAPDDSLETITGPCIACDRLGLIDGNGMCQGCVLDAIMKQQSHA